MDSTTTSSESRRGFLILFIRAASSIIALLTVIPGLLLSLAPALNAGKRKQRKVIFKSPADRNSASFVIARLEGQEETAPGVFIKTENGQATVFSARCTHAACAVTWNESDKHFVCPCHGGKFDTAGKVVAGPPPRPLEKLASTVQGSDLMVEEPEA